VVGVEFSPVLAVQVVKEAVLLTGSVAVAVLEAAGLPVLLTPMVAQAVLPIIRAALLPVVQVVAHIALRQQVEAVGGLLEVPHIVVFHDMVVRVVELFNLMAVPLLG
jgi:hypothetical protein